MVKTVKITLQGYKCERCGHEWIPKGKETPKVCPKCKSPYWNVPRKNKTERAVKVVDRRSY